MLCELSHAGSWALKSPSINERVEDTRPAELRDVGRGTRRNRRKIDVGQVVLILTKKNGKGLYFPDIVWRKRGDDRSGGMGERDLSANEGEQTPPPHQHHPGGQRRRVE